ncbi:MAG: hypothetical protein AMJ65_08285 [Phycisphaerae bacterium SG8_4]|nr:MAG: hypothetical protein AMJ65_08285 [Phycisphaerae bacterium SG8_4]
MRLRRYRFQEAAILLFLELKAETLECARCPRGTDGDGVQEKPMAGDLTPAVGRAEIMPCSTDVLIRESG